MTEKRPALGRGLETLLPSRPTTQSAPQPHSGEVIHQLALELIDRNPYQTRTRVDEAALLELAESIKATGVLQPITVRAVPGGRYQLIAGERRWLASQRAGKATVPSIVRQVSNEQAMEMTIIENLQREDLNPIEQARAFDRLGREFGLTQEQISMRTGKERSSVANFLRLLRLPVPVQAMIERGELSFGHAKALLAAETPESALKLAERIVDRALSVRQTEEAITGSTRPSLKELDQQLRELRADPNVREAAMELERALGVRVTITDRKGRGKIRLDYNSLEDFDRIVTTILSK